MKYAPIYRTRPLGILYETGENYDAWCPTALHYDRRLRKFIAFIFGCDMHASTYTRPYFTTIDPDTLKAGRPRPVVFLNEANEAVESFGGLCSFVMLNTGEYIAITRINGVNFRVVSADCGETWRITGPVELRGVDGQIHFWGLYRANGSRLIAGYDSPRSGVCFSDDGGQTWTHAPIEGCEGLRANEPCIVQLAGDSLMAVIRRTLSGESGEETALLSFSDDNGATWTPAVASRQIRMNASDCSCVVHDGMVELFALSRFHGASPMRTRTGTDGEIRHYATSIEGARCDRFTDLGVVVSSVATEEWGAGDFSTPCCAVDDCGRMLMVYFDAPRPGSTAYMESRHYYVAGELTDLHAGHA